MNDALTALALALATVSALSICLLAARRLVVAYAQRRRLAATARLTPLALALLAGDMDDVRELGRQDRSVLAFLLSGYAQHVHGAETQRIADYFERHGSVDRELRRLRSRRAWRRATAAFALGNMGSRDGVPALCEALEDGDAGVRKAAARSLGRLGAADAVAPIVRAFAARRLPRSVAGQALLTIGPPALPALRDLELAPNADARAFAVELVGLLGDASDGIRIGERLQDTSAEVRAKAARALGRLGAEEGTEALGAALDDRVVFVRVAAAHALASVGDRGVLPQLIRVARTDEFDAARAAAQAAARLDPRQTHDAARAADGGAHLREAADLLLLRR